MHPLIPYLMGEPHPQGKRLTNVQKCLRTDDIDEVGDSTHHTFFLMLGNWSLGDPARNASQSEVGGYWKKEAISWSFEFLTQELGLPLSRIYITIFGGKEGVARDDESKKIWIDSGISENHIFEYIKENWWGPVGETGPCGPDTEMFYDTAGGDLTIHKNNARIDGNCHPNCSCKRFVEIWNNVFMEYNLNQDGSFQLLAQKNVDTGMGAERMTAILEGKEDAYETELFVKSLKKIEEIIGLNYGKDEEKKRIRIILDHLRASVFILSEKITPSNVEQGYILRRLVRRAIDAGGGKNLSLLPVVEDLISVYSNTFPEVLENFEFIKNTYLSEEEEYKETIERAKKQLKKEEDVPGKKHLTGIEAFNLYATHGLSPTQIRSMGYTFNERDFANEMEKHKNLSRIGAEKKFKGGLMDDSPKTVMGHTATHLLHRALKDVLGEEVNQIGSNINPERLRLDFSFTRKLTEDEIKRVEEIVNEKIKRNLSIHFEILDINEARKTGAIGLFGEKYGDKVKVYFIGAYSAEFCGGPHIGSTGDIKNFKIIKEEGLGQGKRRIYAIVE